MQVVFSEDMLAAVDTKNDPSTAWARVLVRKANGKLKLTCRRVFVVNRFMNISVDAGTYGKVEYIDGEWQPYAADCAGESVSEGSEYCSEDV